MSTQTGNQIAPTPEILQFYPLKLTRIGDYKTRALLYPLIIEDTSV